MFDKIKLNKFNKFLISTIPLSIYNANMVICFMITFIFINKFKDNKISSSFSIIVSFYYLFSSFINFGLSEILGIKVSKNYGKNNIDKCSEFYFKTMLLLFFFIIIFIPIFMNFKHILLAFNIDNEKSVIIGSFFQKFYFIMSIISFNRINESYLMSQNKINIFIIINVISVALFPLLCFIFITTLEWKINGILISYLVKELLILISGLVNFYINAEIKFNNITKIFKKIWKFIKYSFFIIVSVISESVGVQSVIICLMLLNNDVENTLWGLWVNIIDLNYYIGFSFSNGIRTHVGYLYGRKNYDECKKFNRKIYLSAIIFVVVECIFLFLFNKQVTNIFCDDEDLKKQFSKYLYIYSIFIINDITFGMFGTTLRIINKYKLQSISTFIGLTIVMPIFSYIFVYLLKYGFSAGFYIYVIITSLLNILQIIYFLTFKWNNLNTVLDVDEYQNMDI